VDEGPQPPPLLNRIGGPFSVHEVAVSGCPSARPAYGRARREGACRDTASDAMLGGRLTTLGTQLCSEITLRTLTLPESDRPAGP
jgi:hypothetical protein